MGKLSDNQIKFFELLKSIQESAVFQSINEMNRNKESIEDTLFNATYEVIVSLCEVLDGYNDIINLELIDKENDLPLRTGIELHDVCEQYLNWKNPYQTKE